MHSGQFKGPIGVYQCVESGPLAELLTRFVAGQPNHRDDPVGLILTAHDDVE